MHKTKILFVSNIYWNFYNFRKELIFNIAKKNETEIFLFAKNDKFKNFFKKKNIQSFDWKIDSGSINPFLEIYSLIHLFIQIIRIRPNIIFTFTPKANIYVAVLSLFFKFKFCPNITGMGSYFIRKNLIKKIYNFFYKKFFFKSKFIFVQNEHDRNYFHNQYKIKNSKIILLPGSGVDIKKYKPKYQFNNTCLSFLMVARLIYEKGVEEFYYASKKAHDRNPNLKFYLIGDYDDKNRNAISKELFFKIKNCNHIHYSKFQNKLFNIMHDFDCFILPSYREGKSKFLLEGLAIGKPLIVSNVPGCEELCSTNNGYVFENKSVNSLFNSIEKMSKKSKSDMIKMGKFSRKLSEKYYDQKFVINKYYEIIDILK